MKSRDNSVYIPERERECSQRVSQDGEGCVIPLFSFSLFPHQGFQLFAITEATAGPPGKRHRGE